MGPLTSIISQQNAIITDLLTGMVGICIFSFEIPSFQMTQVDIKLDITYPPSLRFVSGQDEWLKIPLLNSSPPKKPVTHSRQDAQNTFHEWHGLDFQVSKTMLHKEGL